MKEKKQAINLKLVNNTNFPQKINILGSVVPQGFSNNVSNEYVFDLSTENFASVTTLELRYKLASNPSTVLQILRPLIDLSISGVVNLLNSFNVGVFFSQGSFIHTNSNYYIYVAISLA